MTTESAPKRRRKAAKRVRKTKTSASPESPSSEPSSPESAAAISLEAFCQSVEYDEIAFQSWENCHEDLDLNVPIWLSADDARRGGERVVNFCRHVRETSASRPVKTPASVVVSLPPGAADGTRIRLKGQGDGLCDQTGDLTLTVRIKTPHP